MKKLFRFRNWIQMASAFVSNAHITGFLSGKIYNGSLKSVCLPVLNCYSCPAALSSCPIGAMQAVISGNRHHFSYYVFGLLLLFGTVLGRLICGFLCPFGWIQQLLKKLSSKTLSIPRRADRAMRLTKYGVLILFVLALPAFAVDAFGLGAPWFCKWICPAGTLEGGIPLVLTNASLRSGLGFTFWWKVVLLALIVLSSIFIYRPFCKYLCPLGSFYSLFNRFSLTRMELDEKSCVACGSCVKSCPMQVDVIKNINSAECIRCGACAAACPTGAIELKFGKISIRKNETPDQKGVC